MKEVIWGLIVFIITFLVNYYIIFKLRYNNLKNGKKKKKKYKGLEQFLGFSYLIPKFNLDVDKIDVNFVFICCSIINSFIITFVAVVIFLLPWDKIFGLLLGFVLLFGLIYSLYELFGRILVKKGWQKE